MTGMLKKQIGKLENKVKKQRRKKGEQSINKLGDNFRTTYYRHNWISHRTETTEKIFKEINDKNLLL
jgi:hypothetical protein